MRRKKNQRFFFPPHGLQNDSEKQRIKPSPSHEFSGALNPKKSRNTSFLSLVMMMAGWWARFWLLLQENSTIPTISNHVFPHDSCAILFEQCLMCFFSVSLHFFRKSKIISLPFLMIVFPTYIGINSSSCGIIFCTWWRLLLVTKQSFLAAKSKYSVTKTNKTD